MSPKEKYLASELLERAADEFANHSCNDFDFPGEWSEEDKNVFIYRYHCWNGDPEEFNPKHLHLPDFAVMKFLAIELRKEAQIP